MPIIAACTVSRCDASTERWTVALTFTVTCRVADFPVDRLRVLPFPLSDGSATLPPLLLAALAFQRFLQNQPNRPGVLSTRSTGKLEGRDANSRLAAYLDTRLAE